MNQTYRIRSILAPDVEGHLLNYDITDKIVDFFYDLKNIFERLQNTTILTIPIELLSVFESNKKLRMFSESICSDTQANIIFSRHKHKTKCMTDEELLHEIIPNYSNVYHVKIEIINSLINRRYPLVVGLADCDILKIACRCCADGFLYCKDAETIDVGKLPDVTRVDGIQKITRHNIDRWHIYTSEITDSDIKSLSYLIAIFYGLDIDIEKYLKCYNIHPGFLRDIRNNPSGDFSNIAFSMLRAVAFDPISSKNRHKFSIDLHPNSPFKLSGYDLYRVDVMPPSKSGNSSSGLERLLLAKNKSQSIFLCYTEDHDFVTNTIKERLSTAETV